MVISGIIWPRTATAKGIGRLVFGDGLEVSQGAWLEVVLGQGGVSQLRFILRKRKRSALVIFTVVNMAGSGKSFCLRRHLKFPNEAVAWSGESFLYENQSCDNNAGLFGLIIGWDLARAFLVYPLLTVSPPDFQSSNNDSNHNVGGPFLSF